MFVQEQPRTNPRKPLTSLSGQLKEAFYFKRSSVLPGPPNNGETGLIGRWRLTAVFSKCHDKPVDMELATPILASAFP